MGFVKVDAREFKWLDSILPKVTSLFNDKVLLLKDGKELYLLTDDVYTSFKKLNKPPEFAGVLFANISDEVKFSFYVADNYFKFGKRKVIVNKYGEEKFLYKRNLTGKHIISFTNDFSEGDLVLVVNKVGDVLGFGKALFSAKDGIRQGTLIKNVLDKGYFVKH
ncbi:MAG: hypothetical protein J7K73_03395 [Nanoarchaeota archaeon]|nr:hypothetical protein [Nanoarchaeota archaeon]